MNPLLARSVLIFIETCRQNGIPDRIVAKILVQLVEQA